MKVSLRQLSIQLGIPQCDLLDLEKRAGGLYRTFPLVSSKDRFGCPVKVRQIDTPRKELRRIQNRIQSNLLAKIEFPDYLHGSIKGRSPKSNAAAHLGKAVVVCIDIKSYFPSITHHHVFSVWRRLDYSPRLSRLLTKLTTRNRCLPQGAPTSPLISNLVLQDFDRAVERLCCERGCSYTRYVDDVFISGRAARLLIPNVIRLLQRAGFKAKRQKTRVLARHREAQVVTGITVNHWANLSATRVWRSRLRQEIRSIRPDSCREGFKSIQGKINYVEQINPGEARVFRRLFDRQVSVR